MSRVSPVRALQEQFAQRMVESRVQHAGAAVSQRPGAAVGRSMNAEIEYVPYGLGESESPAACELVATFGPVEAEYAAIRRGAGVLDCPHRGTLLVTGKAADRRDLLNRLVTQELKDLQPGQCKESFWLNRKGRIDADLFVIELGDRMWIDVDVLQASAAAKTLGEFVFAEDVSIVDASEAYHHFALHGRHAIEAIAAAAGVADLKLEIGAAAMLKIAGAEVVAARRDQAGEVGIELIMQTEDAPAVWSQLLNREASTPANSSFPARPIGWTAFNIARIEAGAPLMNIDFGTTNLPHETGILKQRVSFTKGCYLGQEIVARMESLGKPRQVLVGLRMMTDVLPESGAQVFALGEGDAMGEQVGVVTSSTLSPMLGAQSVAFGMLRTTAAEMGKSVLVNGEGEQAKATISELRFLPGIS